jgi:PST family polysaccharide transporter
MGSDFIVAGQVTSSTEVSATVAAPLAATAARGALWSGMGTIILRLGGLVVGITLARLLTPEQFGVYAVALTVQAILIAVADLGLSADIIRSDEPERVAPTVAALGLASGVLIAVVTLVASRPLAHLLGSPEAAPAIAVLAATLMLAGATVVPYAMLQRRFQQRELFVVGVTDFVVSTTLTLILVALGFGVLGLAIGRVTAQVVSSTMQFVFARVKPHYKWDRKVVRPVLAFGLPIAAANLLSWALLNVDNIVLVRAAGAAALGYYVLAFNISSWPMSALSQVVRSISLPYFARTGDSSAGLAGVMAVAWAGALPAGAVLAALSGPVVEVLYGPKWLPAAPVLATLGLYGSIRVLFDIFAGYLYARGQSAPVLWIQLVSLGTLVVAMIFATRTYGIVGAGFAHISVAVSIALPSYLVVLRRCGVHAMEFVRACWWPTTATVPAVGLALLARAGIDHPLRALLVGGAGAVMIYTLLMWPWLRRRLAEIRTTAVPGELEAIS